MDDNVYRVIEVYGSSNDGLEDAIRNGIKRAGKNLKDLGWFEVTQIRGHLKDNNVEHFQVGLKVGFTLND